MGEREARPTVGQSTLQAANETESDRRRLAPKQMNRLKLGRENARTRQPQQLHTRNGKSRSNREQSRSGKEQNGWQSGYEQRVLTLMRNLVNPLYRSCVAIAPDLEL